MSQLGMLQLRSKELFETLSFKNRLRLGKKYYPKRFKVYFHVAVTTFETLS
jgi:hypothetical protein